MTSESSLPNVLQATLRMEDRNFGPSARCVFCCLEFTDFRPPTDEHIVPAFAGGKVIIKGGSCVPCARHSNDFYETPFSHTTFHAYRLWSGLLKSNARGLLPAAKGKVLFTADEAAFTVPLTRKTRPALFTLILLPPPLYWSGLQGDRHETLRMSHANWTGDEQTIESSIGFRMDRRNRPQGVVRTYLNKLDLTLQERHDMRGLHLSVAKIGYCFGIAALGFAAFDHAPIRALLDGKRIDMATFVGGYDGDPRELPSDSLHLVHLRLRNGVWSAIVHLYATKHGHPYEVVLGVAR